MCCTKNKIKQGRVMIYLVASGLFSWPLKGGQLKAWLCSLVGWLVGGFVPSNFKHLYLWFWLRYHSETFRIGSGNEYWPNWDKQTKTKPDWTKPKLKIRQKPWFWTNLGSKVTGFKKHLFMDENWMMTSKYLMEPNQNQKQAHLSTD